MVLGDEGLSEEEMVLLLAEEEGGLSSVAPSGERVRQTPGKGRPPGLSHGCERHSSAVMRSLEYRIA